MHTSVFVVSWFPLRSWKRHWLRVGVIVHVMIWHLYEENSQCFQHWTLLTKSLLIFTQTVGFWRKACSCMFSYKTLHAQTHTHTHKGWRGRWQQCQRSSRPSRWQSEFHIFSLFSLLFFNCWSCGCLINFHIHSGSSWNPRTERRARWSWTYCKLHNKPISLITCWRFYSLSCRNSFSGTKWCWWKERWSRCPWDSCKYQCVSEIKIDDDR